MRALSLSLVLLSTALPSLVTATSRSASLWVQQNPGSNYCSIADLQMSGAAQLSPSFSHYQKTYSCSCPTDQDTVTLQVTLGQADGQTSIHVTKDGQSLPDLRSGQVSAPIHLHAGSNIFTVSTSCNVCNSVYTIVCNRPTPPPTSTPPPPPGTGGENQPPLPPPGVIGDPQFTGLLGQKFQVHGVANEVYNLVSTPHMQMNAKFVFLDEGECPVINGETKRGGCYSHPGSYLGEVAVKTSLNDRIHIVSGDATVGFTSVTFNAKQLKQGEVIELKTVNPAFGGWVSLNDTHTVTLQLSKFTFVILNSDMFVNQRVGFESLAIIADQSTHGLLGQTWSEKENKQEKIKEIEGTVDDYIAPEQNLWSDEFVYNRFGKE